MAIAFVRPDVLYAWKGPTLLIVNTRGECGPDQPLSGHYFREARFLKTLRLEINGEPPWLCEAASLAPDCLALNFVHPEIKEPGGGGTGQSGDEEATDARGLPERSLDIRLLYRVGIAELTITNRARQTVQCELAWRLDADYADIQEAQAGKREQQGGVDVTAYPGRAEFAYRHPRLPFRTRVHHDNAWTFTDDHLAADLRIEPQEIRELTLPRLASRSARRAVYRGRVRSRIGVMPVARTIRAGTDPRQSCHRADHHQQRAGFRVVPADGRKTR